MYQKKIAINSLMILILLLSFTTQVFSQDVRIVMEGNKATVSIPPIDEGTVAEIPVSGEGSFNIRSISIAAAQNLDSNEIIIEILDSKPMDLEDVNGTVYNYFSIDPGMLSSEDLLFAKIQFSISQDWITDNNIDVNKIGLLGIFEGKWSIFPTVELENNPDEVVFSSDISNLGFIQYAQAGNIPVVDTTTTTTTVSTTTSYIATTTTTSTPIITATETRTVQGDDTFAYIAIGIAVAAVVILIFLMRSKKEVKQD